MLTSLSCPLWFWYDFLLCSRVVGDKIHQLCCVLKGGMWEVKGCSVIRHYWRFLMCVHCPAGVSRTDRAANVTGPCESHSTCALVLRCCPPTPLRPYLWAICSSKFTPVAWTCFPSSEDDSLSPPSRVAVTSEGN